MKSRVTRSDATIVALAWIVLLAIGLVLWKTLGTVAMVPLIATAAAIVLWQQYESVRRTSEQLVQLRKDAVHDFRQAEALLSIISVLKPDHPLPPTRDHSASPDLLQMVIELITQRRPGLIVELGSGSSTVFLAYALKRVGRGRIISLDHESRFVERTRSMLEQHGLSAFATVIHCPLVDIEIGDRTYTWYDADTVALDAAIDMVLIDGPPYHVHPLARYPAIPLLKPFLSTDAVIVLDDADRPEELSITGMWRKEYNNFIFERLDTEKGALLITRSPFAPDSASGEIGED